MTSAMIDAAGPGFAAAGPLERQHLKQANYRAVADNSKVTRTHWHIALANGLGWGFDGMDGVIFAWPHHWLSRTSDSSIPDLPVGGMQIALLVGIFGQDVRLAVARRPLRAADVTCTQHRAVLADDAGAGDLRDLDSEVRRGALLVGTLPSMASGRWDRCWWRKPGRPGAAGAGDRHQSRHLVLRGRPGRGDRHVHHCQDFGWRFAFAVPAVVALIAVYVRAKCPGVRRTGCACRTARPGSRVPRLGGWRCAGAEDQEWVSKANRIQLRQLFLPDMRRNTAVATFIAWGFSTTIYGTVGGWMPLYLSTEKHWSTAEYSTFYVLWGLVGFFGLCTAGWLADKIGRRVGFIALLIWGAVFMTLWVYAVSNLWLWIFGLAWSFGFLGFWGPSTTLTSEIFPTRIRGVANGVVWFIGYFVGFVLWPFATVALHQATGSFALAFLTIPVFMAAMAVGVWFIVPEHAGKELDAIAV